MSLIERAAAKLSGFGGVVDEAKRSAAPKPEVRVELPAQSMPEKVMGNVHAAEAASSVAASVAVPEVNVAVESRQPPKVLRYRDRSDVNGSSGPAPRARRFDLDLVKLAAAGFITPSAPRSQLANEFRVIKRPLLANAKARSGPLGARANLIMVTSAMPGEGKSFTALNLAMSIAMEMDNTVLLVDGDVAQPSLSRILDLPPTQGMIELLTDSRKTLQDVLLRTNVDKLTIMPAGAPHERNTELLASDAMNDLLDEVATRYSDRIIIFDSPPLLPTTESRVLATHMGQVVVVVESLKTTQQKLSQALSTIEACPVVMTVLNKAKATGLGEYYGYYS